MEKVVIDLQLQKANNAQNGFYRSYPHAFIVSIGEKPMVRFPFYVDYPSHFDLATLTMSNLARSKWLEYPADSFNNSERHVLEFCRTHLSGIRDGHNGEFFTPKVEHSHNDYVVISHNLYGIEYNTPWYAADSYYEYIKRLKLCASFFNIKFTGCIKLSCKQMHEFYWRNQ